MTTATAQQVVTFRVGEEHFAADILAVERVLRHVAPMPVPNLPAWMEGVLEYESRVVPVIDLRRRFGLGEEGRPATGVRIIVFRAGEEWVGAMVDAVLEVVNIDGAQLSPPPPLLRGLKAEYVRGLLHRDGRMIILLEMARLLTATEHVELQRASLGGASSDG
jgi:purine-binding chemotaxis protein CheW